MKEKMDFEIIQQKICIFYARMGAEQMLVMQIAHHTLRHYKFYLTQEQDEIIGVASLSVPFPQRVASLFLSLASFS